MTMTNLIRFFLILSVLSILWDPGLPKTLVGPLFFVLLVVILLWPGLARSLTFILGVLAFLYCASRSEGFLEVLSSLGVLAIALVGLVIMLRPVLPLFRAGQEIGLPSVEEGWAIFLLLACGLLLFVLAFLYHHPDQFFSRLSGLLRQLFGVRSP